MGVPCPLFSNLNMHVRRDVHFNPFEQLLDSVHVSGDGSHHELRGRVLKLFFLRLDND